MFVCLLQMVYAKKNFDIFLREHQWIELAISALSNV